MPVCFWTEVLVGDAEGLKTSSYSSSFFFFVHFSWRSSCVMVFCVRVSWGLQIKPNKVSFLILPPPARSRRGLFTMIVVLALEDRCCSHVTAAAPPRADATTCDSSLSPQSWCWSPHGGRFYFMAGVPDLGWPQRLDDGSRPSSNPVLEWEQQKY